MQIRNVCTVVLLFAVTACGENDGGPSDPVTGGCAGHAPALPTGRMQVISGQDQCAPAGDALTAPIEARVTDASGDPVAGVMLRWTVVGGTGTLSVDSSLTDSHGLAETEWTLGPETGGQFIAATATGAPDTALFHATAQGVITVLAGGDNVPDQCTSDLWVHGNYGYTGTWGNCGGQGAKNLNVWNVSSGVALASTTVVSASGGTVSDNEVSEDGTLLLATFEVGGSANGLYLYSLADPAHPALLGTEFVNTGLHTGTFGVVGGQRYIFASKNASSPAVITYRVQPDSADPLVPIDTIPIPANYTTHDQFFRDGFLLVSAWNTGLRIIDVGNGTFGGTPSAPVGVSTFPTGDAGLGCICTHNAWWYHDSAGGTRYVFVGQEGPGSVGSQSSGDIHVMDISIMGSPVEVAFYHLAGAGVHNFWMDETRGILYAAYYNGGVVALDVTGTLNGDLASREIAWIQPGGAGNTYVWGVMLANGTLWASDMISGFWKLSLL